MKASAQLELFILDVAPRHYVSRNAPSTFDEVAALREDFLSGEEIPVSGEGCDHTVFSAPYINHAFRAWHDGIHAVHGYNFSLAGEQATLAVHHAMMGYRAAEYGLVEADYALITIEVLAQRMWYERTRTYVKDQSHFADLVTQHGILRVLDNPEWVQ